MYTKPAVSVGLTQNLLQDRETISFRENHRTTKKQCQKLYFEMVPDSDTMQFTVTTCRETNYSRALRCVPALRKLLAGAQVKISHNTLEGSQ